MTKETIIRTIILALALSNQLLTAFGKSPLIIEDELVSQLISAIFTISASIWAWWKNNSVTKNAIKADEYLKELKKNGD